MTEVTVGTRIAPLVKLRGLSKRFGDVSLDEAELSRQEENLRTASAPKYGMDMVYQAGFLMTAILAASSIATENQWGTIRTILSRTGNRVGFLSAKMIAVLLFAVTLSIAGRSPSRQVARSWRSLAVSTPGLMGASQ